MMLQQHFWSHWKPPNTTEKAGSNLGVLTPSRGRQSFTMIMRLSWGFKEILFFIQKDTAPRTSLMSLVDATSQYFSLCKSPFLPSCWDDSFCCKHDENTNRQAMGEITAEMKRKPICPVLTGSLVVPFGFFTYSPLLAEKEMCQMIGGYNKKSNCLCISS